MEKTAALCLFLACTVISTISALRCNICDGVSDISLCRGEEDCSKYGDDQVCQNDYRIVNNKVTMRKKCKQRSACEAELLNDDNNCDEHGGVNTVCRCCCSTNNCNKQKKGCFYPSDCRKPKAPENGFVNCPDRLKPGKLCTFVCNKGYKLKGEKTTTCRKDRETGKLILVPPQPPICEKDEVRCKPPHTAPKNGAMTCLNTEEYKDKLKFNYEGSLCRFTCKEHFQLFGKKRSKCLPSGKWSSKAPICRRGFCGVPLPPDINRIEKCTAGYKVGSECTYQCKKGFKLIGTSEIECEQNVNNKQRGIWSDPPPRCQRLKCFPQQKAPSHGAVSCTNKNFEYSVCTFTCDAGYDMDATTAAMKQITCEDDGNGDAMGQWSGKAPKCSPIHCKPRAVNPLNGEVSCTKNNLVGSVCTYKCDSGYDIDGSPKPAINAVCQDDGDGDNVGKWSRKPATCSPIVCEPEHIDPENGKVSCSHGNRLYSVCTFRCDDFYDIDGTKRDTKTSTCIDDGDGDALGKWSPGAATCSPIKCNPRHINPENGLVFCTAENFLGSACTFTCLPGYKRIGKEVSTCEDRLLDGNADGEWSSKPPICEQIICTLPIIDPSNIKRKCRHESGVETIIVGTVCSYTCAEDGHYMTPRNDHDKVITRGKVNATCHANETWSTPPPTCHPVICLPVHEAPEHGFSPSCTDQNRYQSRCTFKCKNNYALTHERPLICQDDGDNDRLGNWSEGPPKCEKNVCDDFGQIKFGRIEYSNGNNIGSVGDLTCDERYTPKKYENITCLPKGGRRTEPDWDHKKYVCCVRCDFNSHIRFVMVVDKTAVQTPTDKRNVISFAEISLFNLKSKGFDIQFGLVLYGNEVDTKQSILPKELNRWEDIDIITEELYAKSYGGKGSNAGKALQYANDKMFNSIAAEEPYLILTAGNGYGKDVVKIAEGIRRKAINVLGVGFAEAASDDAFDSITGNSKNVFTGIDSPSELKRVNERITQISLENGCGVASKTKRCPT